METGSPTQIATELGCRPQIIYKYLREGLLKPINAEGKPIVDIKEVKLVLAQHTRGAGGGQKKKTGSPSRTSSAKPGKLGKIVSWEKGNGKRAVGQIEKIYEEDDDGGALTFVKVVGDKNRATFKNESLEKRIERGQIVFEPLDEVLVLALKQMQIESDPRAVAFESWLKLEGVL